jgi:hypothetical protein
MAGHKKRNGGCGCGGMCGNPHCGPKRRNPSYRVQGDDLYDASGNLIAGLSFQQTSSKCSSYMCGKNATTVSQASWGGVAPFCAKHAAEHKRLLKSKRNPSLNVRNPSRKVHTGSEDYRLGLFQGAMEKGKLPPPHDTSADFKRGYADGAKVAAARPAASAESLGVYKATGSQPQAGAVLYDAVKGEAVATLRNPSINVRNPSGAKSEGSVQKFTNVSGQTGWLVYDRHGHRVGFYATKPLALEMLAFANSKRHSTSSVVSGPLRNPMSAAARKHLAHEKGEEKAFVSMMAALAEGVTVKVGAHRVRKLSKGYVVVDGERLTTTQAAAKLHRGK